MNNKYPYQYIYDKLNELYPDARCQLDYTTPFQLTIAVSLSAQTTDVAVNKVTKTLFEKYPDVYALANADINDVIEIIRSLGLYKNKSKNIINLSKQIVSEFNGKVPDNMLDLTKLNGIGRKSANVILSNCFDVDAIAVDTHVSRVSKRLNIANESDSVLKIEEKLMDYFPKHYWSRLHHLLIFFGRYMCKSVNPNCIDCPFNEKCLYKKD